LRCRHRGTANATSATEDIGKPGAKRIKPDFSLFLSLKLPLARLLDFFTSN
jgi:hypothetical protein